jgi:hypothetical protein
MTTASAAYSLLSQILTAKRAWDTAHAAGNTAGEAAANHTANDLRQQLIGAGYSTYASLSAGMTSAQLATWLAANPPTAAAPPASGGTTGPATDGPAQAGSDLYGNTPAGRIIGQVVSGLSGVWTWATTNWRAISLLIGLGILAKMLRVKLNLGGGKR